MAVPATADRTRRRLWLIVIAAAVVGALAALALIATTAAKATGRTAGDNQAVALSVGINLASRPQRLGLDPAAYPVLGR